MSHIWLHISHQGAVNSTMTTVTGWTVRYHPISNSNDVTERSHDADTNEVMLTGLSKGTSYTVSVAAETVLEWDHLLRKQHQH